MSEKKPDSGTVGPETATSSLASSKDGDEDGVVVYTPRIWHARAKRYVYRKNGKMFRFVIRRGSTKKRATRATPRKPRGSRKPRASK